MDIPWRTISQVKEADKIFDTVQVGDEVAITQYEDEFWWLGTVTNIEFVKGGRDDRFQERKVITVKCFEPIERTRPFYADCVEQIAFKENHVAI